MEHMTPEAFGVLIGGCLLITLGCYLYVEREGWLPVVVGLFYRYFQPRRDYDYVAPAPPPAARASFVRGDEWDEISANERTNERTNAGSEASQSQTAPRTPQNAADAANGVLTLTNAEIAAVARMVQHRATAEKANKETTILAGFGLKRGGGPAYARASDLYEALIKPPSAVPQYRPLDADKRPALEVAETA